MEKGITIIDGKEFDLELDYDKETNSVSIEASYEIEGSKTELKQSFKLDYFLAKVAVMFGKIGK